MFYPQNFQNAFLLVTTDQKYTEANIKPVYILSKVH